MSFHHGRIHDRDPWQEIVSERQGLNFGSESTGFGHGNNQRTRSVLQHQKANLGFGTDFVTLVRLALVYII